MEEYNHIIPNIGYVSSTEAILKVCEMAFGGGAWGIVASNQLAKISGPFSYYLWAALVCWILTLTSYILQLLKKPKLSHDRSNRKVDAPRTNDLVMNLFFCVIYLIGLILFGVYAIGKYQWSNNTVAITVIILGFLTLATHMIHASTIITMLLIGKTRWQSERQWIWQGLFKPTPARQSNYTAPASTSVHSPTKTNIAVSNETKTPQGSNMSISSPIAHIHRRNSQSPTTDGDNTEVIYEDVPVEKGGQMQYYNYNESNNKTNDNTAVKKTEEDGAYLNPVFSSSKSQVHTT